MTDRPRALIRGLHNLPDAAIVASVVTIGAFDGVHLGHRAILAQVRAASQQLGLPSVAVVFEPQPNEFFAAEGEPPARLMPLREKLRALLEAGIDRVLCLRFDEKLRGLTADQFIEQVLLAGLGVKHLVVGDDFRFGCDRRGNFALLERWGVRAGFSLEDTATFAVAGERVSSTRIREALAESDFALAARLLGYRFAITGKVVHGNQLGRQLQVPTANVQLRRRRSPLAGVFAVEVSTDSGVYLGVANIGSRPSVDGLLKPLLEVHLLDFDGDLYGRQLSVEFCAKLRSEKKFSSLDELKAQIGRDIQNARIWFASREQSNSAIKTPQ